MKTIITSIIILLLICNLNAQNEGDCTFNVLANIECNSNITLKKDWHIFPNLKVLIAPQFGSLFIESFKYVKGIKNLKNYYDGDDFGLKLGVHYKVRRHINFISVYNLGMLEFDNSDFQKVKNYRFKLSINYAF